LGALIALKKSPVMNYQQGENAGRFAFELEHLVRLPGVLTLGALPARSNVGGATHRRAGGACEEPPH
jgi:hypothetical protein